MNRWTRSLALASVIVGAWAPAMPGYAERLTKHEAVARALAAHPRLAAQDARREATLQQAALDALSPPLRLGLDVENVLGSGALSGLSDGETTLRATYTYERGGKAQLRGERGAALAAVEAARRGEAVAAIAHTAKKRFLALMLAQASLGLAKDVQATALALSTEVRMRSARGVASAADEALAELGLLRAKLDVDQAMARMDDASGALAALWDSAGGVSADDAFEPLPAIPPVRDEAIGARVLAAQRAVLDSEHRLADASVQADVEIDVGVRRFESLNEQALVLSASWPLGLAPRRALEHARIDAQRHALEADLQALSLGLAQRRLSLRQQLARAEHQHRGLAELLIPGAEEVVAAQRQAYERGAQPLSAWLLAHQQAQELHAQRLAVAHRYHRLLAAWERTNATGENP